MADSVLIVEPGGIEAVAKALSSSVRRRILQVLHNRELNVNEVAMETGLSQSATVTHIQALDRAGLLSCRSVPATKGSQKVCTSRIESAVLLLGSPTVGRSENQLVSEMPIGLFFDHEAYPTCGMASEKGFIGFTDTPSTFLDPHRSAAQLIWFEWGYVEYRMPIPSGVGARATSVSVSAEICSEFPGHKEEWPSDITVWMNGVEVGTYRCPGDMGDRPGHLNPGWWKRANTQYGFLKEWRVDPSGAYVDGVRVSDVTLSEIGVGTGSSLSVRFGIKDDAEFRGGLNLFGRRFGNYAQDIRLTIGLDGPT